MALGTSIDALGYDALLAEAQRRIIARSRGEWTLHAPVDPGITLIELFAWLLDQRSYWAAQTDGDFARAIMRLLGERTLPARAAVAPITSRDPLAAGQTLRFAHPSSQVTFTVDAELAPLPLADQPLAIRVDGVDVGADLRARRPFELLHAGTSATAAELDVSLATAIAADTPVTLALLLETDQVIAPEWSPDAVAAGVPAELRFTYRAAAGAWKPVAVADGTGGLRRSGIVRFTLPADAEPVVAAHRFTYTISVGSAAPSFTASPIVNEIRLDVTTARHQVPATIAVAMPPLPLPNRVVQLASAPIEDSVTLTMVEADGQPHAWTAVGDLTTARPGDRVFVVDRTYACLRFGDGLTGRLPYSDGSATAISGAYREGGGAAGNVGIGAWVGTRLGGGGVEAQSIAPAIGGSDTETLEAAQRRIADALRRRTRAATAEDYEVIATRTPGVAIQRAHAAIGFDPAEPCLPAPGVVTVFVVPGVPRRSPDHVRVAAPVADPGALVEVARRFAATRLLGTQVLVETARYRDVDVRVQIAGDPWDPADTRARAEAALRRHLDPLFGGAGGLGWPFGDPVRPSDLMRVAQDAIGEDGEIALVGAATPPGDEIVCGDLAIRSYELPRLRTVRIQIVPAGGA